MVVYSNKPTSDSDLSAYTEEGYSQAFGDPLDASRNMVESGINPDSVKRNLDANDKMQVTSPALKKKKWIKKLFLQYIRKYIQNPGKYIDHPKQIRNLPSWFDDALVLFTEDEISREQKRYIREFFYGLIQYRDNKIASGALGPNTDINTVEANRQLGERSPYQYSDEPPDMVALPRENEMKRVNVMDIAKNVAKQNTRVNYEPQMEDYIEQGPETPVNIRYIPSETPQYSGSAISNVQINKPRAGGIGIEGLIRPLNMSINRPAQQSVPQQPVQQSIPQPVQQQRQAAIRGGGLDLTKFIMGGKEAPSLFPIRSSSLPQPTIGTIPTQQPNSVPQWYRKTKKGKKSKPKIIRKSNGGMIGSIPRDISLKNILGKTSIKSIKPTKSPKSASKVKSVVGKIKPLTNGLATIRNMDRVFEDIKNQSKNNYSSKGMKMSIVSDIKRQCDHAFAHNKFKMESTKVKNNYFDDVKHAYPKMRMEMDMMGDIHENNMLKSSVRAVPNALNLNMSSPYVIKRGSMRPDPVGITSYDFDLGNIYKKKRKEIPEEIFYEE